jgi:hypothetical protein
MEDVNKEMEHRRRIMGMYVKGDSCAELENSNAAF